MAEATVNASKNQD